jgi:hypothetical protein
MFVGSQGRFSTDLDFTDTEDHNHEDIILAMMEAFAHGSRILLDLTFKRSGSMILPQLSQREMSKFLPQYVGQLVRLRKITGEALAVNLA